VVSRGRHAQYVMARNLLVPCEMEAGGRGRRQRQAGARRAFARSRRYVCRTRAGAVPSPRPNAAAGYKVRGAMAAGSIQAGVARRATAR